MSNEPDEQQHEDRSDRSDRSDGSAGSDRSDGSHSAAQSRGGSTRLRPSGGYRKLRSFQVATIVYDATVSFCDRWIDRRSRTHDQMVQAARSGRQNIAEGSRASSTSSQTELRLVNVARASLDELLLDYEDFLRQRGLRVWTKDDRDAMEVREIAAAAEHLSDPSDPTDRSDPTDPSEKTSPARSPFGPYNQWLTHADPAVVANAIICLIHQANYLLDRQISSLEEHFISHGGYSEQLAAARISERGRLQGSTAKTHTTSPAPEQTLPACPLCAKPMRLCTARIGSKTGERFWGCSAYPDCRGTRRVVTS